MTQYLLEEACLWVLDVHDALSVRAAENDVAAEHRALERHAELRAMAARQVGR